MSGEDDGRDVVLGRAVRPAPGTEAAAAQLRVLTKLGQMDTGDVKGLRNRMVQHLQGLPEEQSLPTRHLIACCNEELARRGLA